MTILWANNAASTLAGAITNVATSCNVATGTGVLFPNPTGGNFFCMTFVDQATGLLREIVHVTAKAVDTFTIVRAQEGTTALNWNAGDLAQNLVTAGSLAAFQQGSSLPTGALTPLAPPTIITTAGSHPWTPSVNATGGMLILLQSPGGGASGAAATDGTHISVGRFGGAGAYLGLYLTAAQVTAALVTGALPITLGAAGAGGLGVAGTAGTNSTIGTAGAVATIPGGNAGPTPATVASATPQVSVIGATQTAAPTVLVGTPLIAAVGDGGGNTGFLAVSGPISGGGAGRGFCGPGASPAVPLNTAGANSPSFGGGGGPSANDPSQGNQQGGNGGGPWISLQELAEAA